MNTRSYPKFKINAAIATKVKIIFRLFSVHNIKRKNIFNMEKNDKINKGDNEALKKA